MKQALIISTVSGFLLKFESDNVKLLQSMGYHVHYAANMNEQFYRFSEEQLMQSGVTYHHIGVARSPYLFTWNIRALRELLEIIRYYRISLIHCHEPMGGVLGRVAAAMLPRQKIRVVYTAHGFHFYHGAPLVNNTVYYAVERLLARFTDSIVVINKEDYASAARFRLKPGGRVWMIPGVGLDLEAFAVPKPSERDENRRSHNIRTEHFLLLSVGELNDNKNHQVILSALKLLRNRRQLPEDLRYGICGDGFLSEKLERMVEDYGLDDVVYLFGYCMDIRNYLCMADAVAFPSMREGLGMAALEALAMGIPVLAADNRGTREYMHPGENGFVCGCKDVERFAEGLLRLYEMSNEERNTMREACRNTAVAFSKEKTRSVMREVYQDIDRKLVER